MYWTSSIFALSLLWTTQSRSIPPNAPRQQNDRFWDLKLLISAKKQDCPPNIPISFIRLKISRYTKESGKLFITKTIAESENKEMDDF